jgi:Mitochondrial 28S ribosomal protein S27
VYVSYLKNEFFDDHFDLKDPKHRVGKTLYLAGRIKDDLLGRSAQVLGLGLYQKWHQGVALLEKFAAASADATIVGEVVKIRLFLFQTGMNGLIFGFFSPGPVLSAGFTTAN